MSSLALVGAGGLAREVLAVEREVGRYDRIVLLDDDPGLLGQSIGRAPVVGGVDAITRLDDHHVVVCAGAGAVRRRLVRRLGMLGVGPGRYARVVHPATSVPDSCRVGPGCVLLARVTLTADVLLGAHVVLMPQVTLTHDDVVEDFATLCAGVSVGGHVRIGEAAYVGMNASVRERVGVGGDAVVGMGSVVLASVPAGETWAGVPARSLLERSRPGSRVRSSSRAVSDATP